MGAPGEARPWSRPPQWLVKAAVAAAARYGPVARATDAVVRCFGAALLVISYGPYIAPYLACWIGGDEGCAVALLGCAAAVLASYVVRRLAPLAVPLFLLQTLGRALIDAEEKEGVSKVKEVSAMEHHPENKVGWRQLVKYVKLSTIAIYNTATFIRFISIWMKQANENGCGIPEFVIVLVDVVCLVVSIITLFAVLKWLISEVCGGWSS